MNQEVSPENRYDSLFRHYAFRTGLDWLLLKAQAKAESNFNPIAKSRAGALGLTQFMPATWKEWSSKAGLKNIMPDDPFNPEAAIYLQSLYMQWLMQQTAGSTEFALAAYNCGLTRVKKHMDSGYPAAEKFLPKETQSYVAKILKIYTQYKSDRERIHS